MQIILAKGRGFGANSYIVTADGKHAVVIDPAHAGVANVGVRPTVETGAAPNCETHLLDPVGDIYGKHLTVLLLRRLRGEITFENLEALQAQILQDAAQAKEYIATWLNGQN